MPYRVLLLHKQGAELTVLSTLGQVPDRDSALIMQDLFTNLAAGQSKADALRTV